MEKNNFNVDIYYREAIFIEETLIPLQKIFQKLKIKLEHITLKEVVSY